MHNRFDCHLEGENNFLEKMSQWTKAAAAAFIIFTLVLPGCVDNRLIKKTHLIKLYEYARVIEEQAQVIESHRNTTESMNRTIQQQEAELNHIKAELEVLQSRSELEILFISTHNENDHRVQPSHLFSLFGTEAYFPTQQLNLQFCYLPLQQQDIIF